MQYKQDQLKELMDEIETTLRQKAMMDFEEHREFYPPNNGWEDWMWENEETGESLTQQEAYEWVEAKIGEYAEDLKYNTDLKQAIMDNI